MNDGIIQIRGHHLLCMLGFRGLGYSDEFIKNMSRIVDYIKRNPEAQIELVDRCDAICGACPHQKDGLCIKSQGEDRRPGEFDQNVLSHLGFSPDTRTTAAQAYRSVASRIDKDAIGRLFCTRCEWLDKGFCISGLIELKKCFNMI